MRLIVILAVLAIERYLNVDSWFKTSWFDVYVGWLRPLLKAGSWAGLVVIVLPILIVFAIAQYLLSHGLLGILDDLFAIGVLLACIDAREFNSNNSLEDIFTQAYVRIFAVLFWFAILNVYGAAFYFMLTLMRGFHGERDVELSDVAAKVLSVMDWVPVRLLGLSFALVGHFSRGFGYCLKHLLSNLEQTKSFVQEAGIAALNLTEGAEKDGQAAVELANRALIVWLVAIALITIGSWLP